MKKNRRIRTFEPEQDVEEMLNRAQEGGLKVSDIMNKAVRKYGQRIISGLAKRDIAKLQRLAVASFEAPDGQPIGLAA